MKTKLSNSTRLDVPENGDRSSDPEIRTALLNEWPKRLGYCSIFATIPAVMATHVAEARPNEARKPEANVAGRGTRLFNWLNNSCSTPALLKRQSHFRLPHQNGSFALLTSLAGNDNCPGRLIHGGNYTAAAPYIDSGDTTGANNSVSTFYMYSFGYQTLSSLGPDHVYSFILTARGPNPRIEVSTTSGTYQPLVYVLQGGFAEACPSGTGREVFNALVPSESSPNRTAVINGQRMNILPLNVPLHLFIDSALNDATGSGPYTLRIQDVTISSPDCSNPIDCPEFFLLQHYFDFLGRHPDPPGMAGWLAVLNNCAPGDTRCDRINVSSAFFRSPEFQDRGYFIYRFYSTLGRPPHFNEFLDDSFRVSGFITPQQLEANKVSFVNEFMSRLEFKNKYDSLTNPSAYVDGLLQTVALPNHPTRGAWIGALTNGTMTRAQVLRALVESSEVHLKYFNEAFVVMGYFGYLRRDPDILYLDWIKIMDQNGGDYRVMVNGFINSSEYRQRFGP